MKDPIERQAAIEAAVEYLVEYCGGAFDEEMQNGLIEMLNVLPSAQPFKKGLWVKQELAPQTLRFCSLCGCKKPRGVAGNFCPNCGFPMEVGEEDG